MRDAEPTRDQLAWEPLSPRGVAAFAHATSNRLFLVQFLVALVVAGTVVWFLQTSWFPAIGEAIMHLPDEGELRGGSLDWRGASPCQLAESRFLAISVDLDHSGQLRSPAHLEVEFGRRDFRVRSLLGYLQFGYATNGVAAFNREILLPWWGAWKPQFLALAALSTIAGLMLTWFVLAMLYAPVIWLLAFYVNRDLRLVPCWRLAGAALMPGAVLITIGLLLYGSGMIDLVGLGFFAAGHIVLGWIYLFITPLFLTRAAATRPLRRNPFAAAE